MGILRDDEQGDPRAEDHEYQKDRQAQKAALQAAKETTLKANPQFLEQLREFGLDSEEFPEIEDELGPAVSGAALLGYRSEHHEERRMWLNQNRGERIIAEGDPGRLCRGRLRELAWRVHNREDKEPAELRSVDERRALRNSVEHVTNIESLTVEARLLRALTESVAVTRTEGEQDPSQAEKAAKLIG